MQAPTLQIDSLHKTFQTGSSVLNTLAGVRLDVASGEFVALIGPSGCGKTTLLNVLAGLTRPTSGEIHLDGRIVPDARDQIAYMQQKDLLLPWRTVLDNAVLGLEIQGVPTRSSHRKAQRLLRLLGLAGFEQAYPRQLSGGMRQRVALARTLLLDKPLWLLDEPFGALDAMTRMRLHRYLLEAWQASSATALFVTHDIEEALLLADRIVVMTARPGHIRTIRRMELPRPRCVTASDFVAHKQELLQILRGEEIHEAAYAVA